VNTRYQVFVSSTFLDLQEERRAVMQALLEQDCIPAGMELFLASDQDQWDLITGVIDDCDYYVVIVGARYGSTTEEGVSFTEKEYDYAVDKGIPVLGFLHAHPDKIEIGKGESTDEGRRKQEAFVAKVMSRPIKRFESVGELAAVVGASVSREIKRRPGVGWVRGDQAMTPETAAEMSELRARIAEIELGNATAEANAASSSVLPDTSHLSQGEDLVDVPYQMGTFLYRQFSATHTGDEPISWDEIFKALGPMMIDESNERRLLQRLSDVVFASIAADDRWPKGLNAPHIEVSAAAFDKIKVQLRALNLIDKGTKKRTVSDGQTYWRLTTWGERYLASLLAIRRGDEDARVAG